MSIKVDQQGITTEPAEKQITVEVAYALVERQLILKIAVPAGTTAAAAIELSSIRKHFAGIEKQPSIGIFSRKVSLDYLMQDGDRLEIYRPLFADPKEGRRRKAEEQKARTQQSARSELDKLRRH